MATQFQFADLVFCTLKKTKKSRCEIVKNLCKSAALNGYKFMTLDGGFVISYDFAKRNIAKLHLHCSRFFSREECGKLCAGKLISNELYDKLMN
ncbi:MAG: hypothetical protein J5595_03415 [Bacteroidales bacterium]|nr:hypothetical protein [Bacteroidales bacterium]